MKRREAVKFMLGLAVGLLVGARLERAASDQPTELAPQDDVAVESCSSELEEFQYPGDVDMVKWIQ
ncbi:MAG: hypothetical protein ACRDQZ_25525 [Mycobacteriales bacterium]